MTEVLAYCKINVKADNKKPTPFTLFVQEIKLKKPTNFQKKAKKKKGVSKIKFRKIKKKKVSVEYRRK